MTTDTDIFLAHYGVKGMKWGVRKKHRDARRKDKAAKRRSTMTPQERRADIAKTRKRQAQKDMVKVTAAMGAIAVTYVGLSQVAQIMTNPRLRESLRQTAQNRQNARDYSNAKKFVENAINMNGNLNVSTLSDAAKDAAIQYTRPQALR